LTIISLAIARRPLTMTVCRGLAGVCPVCAFGAPGPANAKSSARAKAGHQIRRHLDESRFIIQGLQCAAVTES
jgi:hypothetical protein